LFVDFMFRPRRMLLTWRMLVCGVCLQDSILVI
jgi:hypothetical protein